MRVFTDSVKWDGVMIYLTTALIKNQSLCSVNRDGNLNSTDVNIKLEMLCGIESPNPEVRYFSHSTHF